MLALESAGKSLGSLAVSNTPSFDLHLLLLLSSMLQIVLKLLLVQLEKAQT